MYSAGGAGAVVDGSCDGDRARVGMAKIQGAIAHIAGSPSVRANFLGHLRAMYSAGGAGAVLAEFAEDRQGHFGLHDASAATKAHAVELLLAAGCTKSVDALFA